MREQVMLHQASIAPVSFPTWLETQGIGSCLLTFENLNCTELSRELTGCDLRLQSQQNVPYCNCVALTRLLFENLQWDPPTQSLRRDKRLKVDRGKLRQIAVKKLRRFKKAGKDEAGTKAANFALTSVGNPRKTAFYESCRIVLLQTRLNPCLSRLVAASSG
jgi:hypothetical protein